MSFPAFVENAEQLTWAFWSRRRTWLHQCCAIRCSQASYCANLLMLRLSKEGLLQRHGKTFQRWFGWTPIPNPPPLVWFKYSYKSSVAMDLWSPAGLALAVWKVVLPLRPSQTTQQPDPATSRHHLTPREANYHHSLAKPSAWLTDRRM